MTSNEQRDRDGMPDVPPSGPDGLYAIGDVLWLLVRTLVTGRGVEGVQLTPQEVAEGRSRLGRLFDIAAAGGWRGQDLLETLMAKGELSERLEAAARKAGTHCERRPDLMHHLFAELYGDDVASECLVVGEARVAGCLEADGIEDPGPAQRSWADYVRHVSDPQGGDEEVAVLGPEATLLMVAAFAHDPAEMKNCRDGGALSRQAVASVLQVAHECSYSRIGSLREMLTSGPFGDDTMTAIEHLVGELGNGVVRRGLERAGFRFSDNT